MMGLVLLNGNFGSGGGVRLFCWYNWRI